jgi:uncharacterized membrane protein YkoI
MSGTVIELFAGAPRRRRSRARGSRRRSEALRSALVDLNAGILALLGLEGSRPPIVDDLLRAAAADPGERGPRSPARPRTPKWRKGTRTMSLARCLCATPVVSLLLLAPDPAAAAAGDFEPFDAAAFDASSSLVDNPWFPLVPGARSTFQGTSVDDEGKQEDHTVVFTVTDLTKVIDGVRTVVIWEQDIVDGDLEESELAFFAQARDGSVWYFGEYPEEYDEGEIVATPGWIHGVKDGRAGILMPAEPRAGTPSFAQGWAPSVPWTDRAQVHQVGQETTVPFGSYTDVLVMDEFSQEEPGAYQLKYYARGAGLVRVGYRGAVTDKEVLELVKREQLDADALAAVRATALEMEARGFEKSPEVYAQTQPLQDREGRALHDPRLPRAAAMKRAEPEPVRKISDEQAMEIARGAVPGEVMDVIIERKLGAKRLVVEVIAEEDGAEIDVIIDMETGEVLGTED